MVSCAAEKFSRGKAFMNAGETAARYPHKTAWIEGVLRPLFGLVPLSAGGWESELWEDYRQGIRQGTDPYSEEYWGILEGKDQKIVEMASLGLALALVREQIWDPLDEKEKKNLAQWLSQINEAPLAANNWLFFPVIVNLGLKKVGAVYSQEIMDRALSLIDKNYLGDGWYSDGPSLQRDYYVAFAMHYYGLIYAALMDKEDHQRAVCYRERAALFAKDFIFWFGKEGDALPFGRSLTYRFAMAAFWSAMVYAGVEGYSWGVIKGILFRNIRWWIRQPIWDEDGLLTIGFRYPNLKMAEFYNAPGSPAWAMKAFLVLALPKEHPFWQADEEELPALGRISVQKHPFMIVMRGEQGRHIQALTSGQYAGFEPSFMAAKYEKFAYSNVFGFSVPGGEYGYDQGAFDSMLALCEQDDNLYRVRRRCESVTVDARGISSVWKPWKDVMIHTWLIPCGSWHVRVHRILSDRFLTGGEGAYAVNCDSYESLVVNGCVQAEDTMAKAWYPWGCTAIVNLEGDRRGSVILPHPNTNLMYSRTKLPALMGKIGKGETWLACAVLGTRTMEEAQREWMQCPVYQREACGFTVIYGDKITCFTFDTKEQEE
ncbi:MAG: DUF2264 domain-containing protein [Lachnospiraceae bacterium]|nr:DUF2264 domain-containing protein [Lachnospiraceae bacterium]